MNDSGIYPDWQMPEHKGPTLDIKAKGTCIGFPYLPDERTADEIQQQQFDEWQQRYEIEQEQQAGRPDEC